jgi:ligand-binding SRPBCC domain-containing protein
MAKVYVSAVIDAPADKVWAYVRDFNGLPKFMPPVAESRIEQNLAADRIGCIRNFSMKDGGRLREQLLALSDYDYTQTYNILESPMPLSNYIATVRLVPITDGNRTFAEWTAEFDASAADAPGLVANIGTNVFLAAFHELQRMLAAK